MSKLKGKCFEPHLGKVPDQMTPLAVILCQDVEEERLHIVVQGLMVQKQFGQKTQVLTVDCAHISINLSRQQGPFRLTQFTSVGRCKLHLRRPWPLERGKQRKRREVSVWQPATSPCQETRSAATMPQVNLLNYPAQCRPTCKSCAVNLSK